MDTIPPFANYANTWLAVARTRYRPNTVAGYACVLRLHVLPHLGTRPLDAVTRQDVRSVLERMLRAGHSPFMARMVQTTISSLLASAMEDGLVKDNAAHGAGKRLGLRRGVREAGAMRADQLARFLAAAAEVAPPYVPLFVLLARSAMRIGEALALSVADVDLAARTARLVRTYHGSGNFGPLKSGRARTVMLSRQAAGAVARQIAIARPPERWLFASPYLTSRLPYAPAQVQKIFKKVLRVGNLPVHFTPHSLRHTAASLLLSRGEPPQLVQQLLGHQDISTTVSIYGSHFPCQRHEAVDQLDDLKGGSDGPAAARPAAPRLLPPRV